MDEGVRALGLGAANLGNLNREMSDAEARAIVDAAWDAGIRRFDTAPHYGLGLSERRLGDALRSRPRDEFTLSTKVGRLLRRGSSAAPDLDGGFVVHSELRRVWGHDARAIRDSVEDSLDRLGMDRVDTVYLHDPERYDLDGSVSEGIPAMIALRDEGLVSKVGVASMDVGALLASARAGGIDEIMLAGRYTLAEQPSAPELLPECVALGIDVVAASVFNSGLLASDRPTASSRYDYGAVPAGVLSRVTRVARLCAAHGVSLPTAALQFPSRHPAVTATVIGASRPQQVTESVARWHVRVPAALWADLAEAGLLTPETR